MIHAEEITLAAGIVGEPQLRNVHGFMWDSENARDDLSAATELTAHVDFGGYLEAFRVQPGAWYATGALMHRVWLSGSGAGTRGVFLTGTDPEDRVTPTPAPAALDVWEETLASYGPGQVPGNVDYTTPLGVRAAAFIGFSYAVAMLGVGFSLWAFNRRDGRSFTTVTAGSALNAPADSGQVVAGYGLGNTGWGGVGVQPLIGLPGPPPPYGRLAFSGGTVDVGGRYDVVARWMR